jgi:protein-tyrosine phosphatase
MSRALPYLVLCLLALFSTLTSAHDHRPHQPLPHKRHSSPPENYVYEGPSQPLLGCDPRQREDGTSQIQHLTLVNVQSHNNSHDDDVVDHTRPPTFLFRGASPDRDNFRGDHDARLTTEQYRSEFLYEDLLGGLRAVAANSTLPHSERFPPLNTDIHLIDINLMWLIRPSDAARIQGEAEFFSLHPEKGEFMLWETYGARTNVSEEVFDVDPNDVHAERKQISNNKKLVRDLLAGEVPEYWQMPDDLLARVEKLEHLLANKKVRGADGEWKTVVIYVHCYCGSDRTGELMGAWNLHHNRLDWKAAQRVNTAIAGRPMGCRNYLAMQLFCLWQSGQRGANLGCMHNSPCTIFTH